MNREVEDWEVGSGGDAPDGPVSASFSPPQYKLHPRDTADIRVSDFPFTLWPFSASEEAAVENMPVGAVPTSYKVVCEDCSRDSVSPCRLCRQPDCGSANCGPQPTSSPWSQECVLQITFVIINY